MIRPLAIDLFCCAGGATRGLQLAGFEVVGVDIKRQPHYCGDHFIQADARQPPVDLRIFDFIWASPPCQAHTALRTMWNAKPHVNLIPETRDLLERSGRPFVIENVPGAPLKHSIRLCGTAFDLGCGDAELRRHRDFESSFMMVAPACRHRARRTIGIHGEGCRDARRKFDRSIPDFTVNDGRKAMGIDWMTIAELCEAIPPAYSEFIGRAALRHIERDARAAA